MKKMSIICIIVLMASVSSASAQKIRWKKNFQQGFNLAKTTRKPMMVYIYSDYCGYCRKMEKELFTKKKIIKKLNRYFVAVSINAKVFAVFKKQLFKVYGKKSHNILRQMIGRGGVPRTIFLDNNGKILATFPGYGTSFKIAFFDLLGYIKDRCYVSSYPFNQYQAKGHCRKK